MQTLYIHPQNPQSRLMGQVVDSLKSGNIVIIPTERGYQFAFLNHAKDAFENLKRLGVDESDLILVCQDLSMVADYGEVDNNAFRTLKNDFCPKNAFILNTTKLINKKIISNKAVTISTANEPIAKMMLEMLEEPFFIAPLLFEKQIVSEFYEIAEKFDSQAEYFVDVGEIFEEEPVVVDLSV